MPSYQHHTQCAICGPKTDGRHVAYVTMDSIESGIQEFSQQTDQTAAEQRPCLSALHAYTYCHHVQSDLFGE